MGATMEQVKLAKQLHKAQKTLKNEIIEVEAGDNAVVVQITGELKIKSVKIDPAKVDLENISQLETWVLDCMRDGYQKAQEIASDRMRPAMQLLGNLGM